MDTKEIALLRGQREKLSGRDFDLEGWKSQTLLFAQRIFGKDHAGLKLIGELKHDYSSWQLRDVTGNQEKEDPVRTKARQVLDAAITELETLGAPAAKEKESRLWQILEEELTGKQLRELQELAASGGPEQMDKIREKLAALSKDDLVGIISRLLAG